MALRKMESGSGRNAALEFPQRFQGPIGLIAIAAAPAFVLPLLISSPLVLPVLSLLSFVTACAIATYALVTKTRGDAAGSTIWNAAYVFTLAWIVAGMMSDHRQVLAWFDNLSLVP